MENYNEHGLILSHIKYIRTRRLVFSLMSLVKTVMNYYVCVFQTVMNGVFLRLLFFKFVHILKLTFATRAFSHWAHNFKKGLTQNQTLKIIANLNLNACILLAD